MPEPIPPAHTVGDTGHTTDHNSIVTVLGDYQTSIGNNASAISALQAATQNLFYTVGANVCNIPGTGTAFATVNLTAVNRDTGVDIFDVYYGTVKVFSVNSYGDIVMNASTTAHVAQTIKMNSGQTAAAFQVLDVNGNVLFRINANGEMVTPNIYPWDPAGSQGGWHNVTFQNGWSASSGETCGYRLVASPPNSLFLHGNLQTPSNNANVVDGTTMFTISQATMQPQTVQWIGAYVDVLRQPGTPSGYSSCAGVRIGTTGVVQCYGIANAATQFAFAGVIPLNH